MRAKNIQIICILSICLMLFSCAGNSIEIPITELKIGDYIQFGNYNNSPILWRVFADSKNPIAIQGDKIIGDPYLFSDKVLCAKAFDAAGGHESSSSQRNENGSNYWGDSSLRSWLNSSDRAGKVKWLDGNPPNSGNVTENEYANEKGFLADGNFTKLERSLIKSVEHKTLLYINDYNLSEGGSTSYEYKSSIAEIVNNYDDSAYVNVTDSVFIPDPKQIHAVFLLFGYYYNNPSSDAWLQAPDASIYTDSSPANVLYVRGNDGTIMYSPAYTGSIGVRPALVLNHDLTKFKSGAGTADDPYVI